MPVRCFPRIASRRARMLRAYWHAWVARLLAGVRDSRVGPRVCVRVRMLVA